MVYVTVGAAVSRAKQTGHWIVRPMIFTLSASAAGLLVGAAVGAVGGVLFDSDKRLFIAAWASVAAIAFAIPEIMGRRVRVPQRSRETSRDWMRLPGMLPVVANAVALGVGWSTRIGFWLWFAVPLGAFLSGSASRGMAVYAIYGLTRGLGPWLLLLIDRVRNVSDQSRPSVGLWAIGLNPAMRRVAASQLGTIGVVYFGVLVLWP